MIDLDAQAHASRWRDVSPWTKLCFCLGLLAESVALPPASGAAAGGLAVAAALAGGARPGLLGRALAAPLAFALVGAAGSAVSLTVDPAGFGLALPDQGAAQAGRILIRSLAACACLLCLTLTTPMVDLIAVLRRLGLPAFVAELMGLVYRFLFLLTDAARAIRLSQAARLGYADARRARRSLALLTAALWPRALDRAARLETGLAARGYAGELRVLDDRPPGRPRTALALAVGAALLLLLPPALAGLTASPAPPTTAAVLPGTVGQGAPAASGDVAGRFAPVTPAGPVQAAGGEQSAP